MHVNRSGRAFVAAAITASLTLSAPAAWAAGGGGGGGGQPDVGSLYSDLVVALRAADGTALLKEYTVVAEEGTTVEYCVQPVSYTAVPGVTSITNPLDDRPVWVLPLQGEWIDNPVDPLPVAEIEACDPQPQYAMFVAETELERLNLTRTSDAVLAQKILDVETKLKLGDVVSLDSAGRIAIDGASLDAAPEYAAIYESLMTYGSVPGLDFADIPYDAWQLAAVAVGTAASKGVPITGDTVQYYNRIVGFTQLDPLPSWGDLAFINSVDPDESTPMPVDLLPGGENFVDYSGFTYNRAETFVGSVTWLDVPTLTWHVSPVLDQVTWTNLQSTAGLDEDAVNNRTLTGLTAFAQMADDTRAVISYLHQMEVIPGFYMDPVLVDTTQEQIDSITLPAVQLTAPGEAFQTLPFQMTASLFNPWGGDLVDEARVRVTVDAPEGLDAADVTLTTGDGDLALSPDVDGDLVGWWGAEAGFPMAPGYNLSTDIAATVADGAPTGPYAVNLELVDIDAPATTLAEDSATVTVHPSATTVLWGAEIPSLGTQGTYVTVPVRVYAPTAQDVVLTFALTGPGDDPTTDLLEELEQADARVYASNGLDMVPMPLTLTGQDLLTGTWPASLAGGYNDLVWYLMVNEGAPIGQYGIDVGIESGTDIADPQYVSFAAPAEHGVQPPDVGEDTTAPLVTITVDGVTADSASFSFTANEEGVSFDCQLTYNGVKGAWEDCDAGTKTYTDLEPGSYTFAVKGTDAAGNAATYVKKFVIDPDTFVTAGVADLAWVLGSEATFTLDSDAEDVTYTVLLNGAAQPDCTTAQCTVTGLATGLNRIEFAATSDVSTDQLPEVRRVFVPYGFDDLRRSAGWSVRTHPDSLFDTFGVTRDLGQFAKVYAPKIKRVALVVTKAPGSGKVHVYLGSKRLTDKPISLSSATVKHGKLITVKTFAKAKSGTIRVAVVSTGKPVRLEGIGIASR